MNTPPEDAPETVVEESQPSPPQGQIVVPSWVILVTFFLGWGAGGALIASELSSGNPQLPVLLLAAWLITLPLVATNPFKALGEILAGLFGGRK